MISKSIIKLTKSLVKKKYRLKENLFLAEGDKSVTEVLASDFKVRYLIATKEYLLNHELPTQITGSIIEATPEEIKRASLLQNPQNSIAICELPGKSELPDDLNDLIFYLDGIQDPGNLGTILRTCDWFGVKKVFCSTDTVDLYNPKVIQASMGSFCRVNLYPVDTELLGKVLRQTEITVYGTFMEGINIYSEKLSKTALVILGNEGQGIREEAVNLVNRKISIPSFSPGGNGAESLNVAVAAGIICSEFKRKSY